MATQNHFKSLKKKFEEWCGDKVSSFPGEARAQSYYCPVRINSVDSTRLWIRFARKAGYDVCIFGDFKKELKTLEVQTDIGFKHLYTSKNDPDPKEYNILRKKFSDYWTKITSFKREHNDYTKLYKKTKYKPYNYKGKIYLPFINPETPEAPISAMQIIDAQGQKFFATTSKVSNSFCVLAEPATRDSLVYIVEGLNTGLACLLGGIEGAGVVCAGGISNVENVLRFFKSKRYNVVLAVEKKGKEIYQNLKVKYDCLLVGDFDFEDVDDLYRRTNLNLLKRNLRFFKEKNYISLGIDKKNDVVCYIKSLDNVKTYAHKDREILFCDVHNTQKPPDKDTVKKFYFKVRFQCRFAGVIRPLNRVKYGIFPDQNNKNFYYWDMQNLYLIKEKDGVPSIVKVNPLSVIRHDFLLCKENAKKRPDLTKLKPLDPKELKELFKPLFLFKFKPIEHRLLLGWVIQSFLCGGLPYRSPIWITAPTGNGKTDISQRLLMKLFPEMDRKTGRNSTPKYFVRQYAGKAMPLHRDEYEPNPRHGNNTREEMEYIRASATERYPSRGISFGLGDETMSFEYCISVLFTSIRTPRELTSADYARILFFYMGYNHHKNYEAIMSNFESKITPVLQYRLLLTCLLKLHKIRRDYFRACGNKNIRLLTNHKKSSIFMLTCCYNALQCFEDTVSFKSAIEYAQKIDSKERPSRLLKTILDLSLKKQHHSVTESFLLVEALTYKTLQEDLKKKGIIIKGNFLLIHEKKGVLFIKRLFAENGEKNEMANILKELKNDGKYYHSQKGHFLRFDWKTIQEDYYGKAKKIPEGSGAIHQK